MEGDSPDSSSLRSWPGSLRAVADPGPDRKEIRPPSASSRPRTSGHTGRVVLTVADVVHVSGANANPHLWYDIPRISQVARAIESELVLSLAITPAAAAQRWTPNPLRVTALSIVFALVAATARSLRVRRVPR
jgi:hypothetical protein